MLNSNNNNFTKPVPGEPVLISLDDATDPVPRVRPCAPLPDGRRNYPTFAGAQRDFVEYPSQVNENWLLTPQVLNRFARHYKTGKPIPQALVDKIEKADHVQSGLRDGRISVVRARST